MNKLQIDLSDNLNINYNGSVLVVYNNGEKIIRQHNTANAALFTALTRVLGGQDYADYLPKYLDAYYHITNAVNDIPQFYNQLHYQDANFFKTTQVGGVETEEVANGTDNNIVRFMFMIPISNIQNTTGTNAKINRLQLKNTLDEICAQVDLTTPIETTAASSILIYWKLRFSDNG